jgi:hypothetical protein
LSESSTDGHRYVTLTVATAGFYTFLFAITPELSIPKFRILTVIPYCTSLAAYVATVTVPGSLSAQLLDDTFSAITSAAIGFDSFRRLKLIITQSFRRWKEDIVAKLPRTLITIGGNGSRWAAWNGSFPSLLSKLRNLSISALRILYAVGIVGDILPHQHTRIKWKNVSHVGI